MLILCYYLKKLLILSLLWKVMLLFLDLVVCVRACVCVCVCVCVFACYLITTPKKYFF